MEIRGIIAGIAAFLIIGVFHPIVIKAEYYFGKKCWPAFLALGIIFCIISLFVKDVILSVVFAIIAFSFFWSIKELFAQEERVLKGWYPKNPKREYPTDDK